MLLLLLACAPRPPDWARAVEPLPEAALRVALDEQGRLWLDGEELSTAETNGEIDALVDAARPRLPWTEPPVDGERLRARVWLDPSRPFGEARRVLGSLQRAGASAWDLEASAGLDAGWQVPIRHWDGVPLDEAVAPPLPVLILRTEDAIHITQTEPLTIRLPDVGGALDQAGLGAALDALALEAHKDAEIILGLDDRVRAGDLGRALDLILAETGQRPQIAGGLVLARPADVSPTPPEVVRVPRRVEIGRDGGLTLELDQGTAEILAHEVRAYWSACAAGRCAILAQPRWGPSWLIAERAPVTGLESRWILGRPVLAWPEGRALPPERPQTTGALPPLPWLIATDPSAGPSAALVPAIYGDDRGDELALNAIVAAIEARDPELRRCVPPALVPANARLQVSRLFSPITHIEILSATNLTDAQRICVEATLAELDHLALAPKLHAAITLVFEDGDPRVITQP